jgi:hypothetical protein
VGLWRQTFGSLWRRYLTKRRSQPVAGVMTSSQHVYEVRPHKDKRGADLISDALPFGRLWYGEPDAISNAVGIRVAEFELDVLAASCDAQIRRTISSFRVSLSRRLRSRLAMGGQTRADSW